MPHDFYPHHATGLDESDRMFFNLFKKKNKQTRDLNEPAVTAQDFRARYQDTIKALQKPCIHLANTENTTKSWLGGLPKIATPDFNWPLNENNHGHPLALIAQIDLQEVHDCLKLDWLPLTGSLLFFYDLDAFEWGITPQDISSFKVIYTEQAYHEIQTPLELEDSYEDSKTHIDMHRVYSWPDTNTLSLHDVHFAEPERELYLCEILRDPNVLETMHRINGYHYETQDGEFPQHTSAMVTRGHKDETPTPETLAITRKDDWRLLLQLESCDVPEFMWVDGGLLTFWIKAEDARNQRFENAWIHISTS